MTQESPWSYGERLADLCNPLMRSTDIALKYSVSKQRITQVRSRFGLSYNYLLYLERFRDDLLTLSNEAFGKKHSVGINTATDRRKKLGLPLRSQCGKFYKQSWWWFERRDDLANMMTREFLAKHGSPWKWSHHGVSYWRKRFGIRLPGWTRPDLVEKYARNRR
jgi:hypothetical protein